MSIVQSGHEAIISKLTQLQQKLQTAPQQALAVSGQAGVDVARGRVRVATGRLRNSIRADATKDTLILGGYTEYAVYNELGTSRMSAQPFIMPGMQRAIAEIGRNLNAALGF